MIIKLKELEKTKYYTKYKVADTNIIKQAFEQYKKENNLTELSQNDKIKVLKKMNYSDDEIKIILQHIDTTR